MVNSFNWANMGVSSPYQNPNLAKKSTSELSSNASGRSNGNADSASLSFSNTVFSGFRPDAAPPNTLSSSLLKTPEGKDKVFVLHSGLNDGKNEGANSVREGLLARGVPADRIIILPNPFGREAKQGGLRENLKSFGEFGKSNSDSAKIHYSRVEMEMMARGLDPARASVTLIGHSAGGQASLGVAEVDKNRQRMVDQVITLGSPILKNAADPKVKITSLDSGTDPIVRLTTGPLSKLIGRRFLPETQQRLPMNLDGNDRIIKIPNLDHRGYYQDPNTMAMVADIALGRNPQQALAQTSQPNTFEAPGPSEKPEFFKSLLSHLKA
jgi:hypothetical protein